MGFRLRITKLAFVMMAGLLGVLPREKSLVVEVDGENRRARALYEKFGFRENRRQDYFVRGL